MLQRALIYFQILFYQQTPKKLSKSQKKRIEVPFLRPKNLARDNSKEIYVWKHALKYLKKINKFPDILVVLPVTSPLRKKKHIYQAINKFQKDKSDALITIKEPENNPYFNMIRLNKKDHAQIIINKKNSQGDKTHQKFIACLPYVLF